ncbi:redox-sensitive bicupin YhaK (pirin superfamily) [Okibacterium sp. HSC-33S16]|uniref:pirin family protein n=1 Tax=Okibacterium sp. HSC-33S16 TaxID=2910965 RepID=UPI00209ECE8C|nr:pirin family protein [Okibacterium sp. HSC-33S16]MCP2031523.1 redox-sensitive bicupin YhaK (pirin superfamily) [Okibacterium sp. HSC-33S16]
MTRLDTPVSESVSARCDPTGSTTMLLEAREVPLGGIRGILVHRSLPQRALPMVGAWCFLDRFDDEKVGMRVLPHPHIGLQTVTWPVEGEIRHRDSVGSDVAVQPGELNIMTSGYGISHSEFSLGAPGSPLRGLQLWVALPRDVADIDPFFERHTDLPVFTLDGLRAHVLVGQLGDVVSEATVFTPLMGADATIDAGAFVTLPLQSHFEYAVMVVSGEITVAETPLAPGPLLYLGTDRESLDLGSAEGARFVILGGVPFGEELIMWWNFVARSHEEIVSARDAWEARSIRFGVVNGHGDERIPAPPLPAVRLTPRRRTT